MSDPAPLRHRLIEQQLEVAVRGFCKLRFCSIAEIVVLEAGKGGANMVSEGADSSERGLG